MIWNAGLWLAELILFWPMALALLWAANPFMSSNCLPLHRPRQYGQRKLEGLEKLKHRYQFTILCTSLTVGLILPTTAILSISSVGTQQRNLQKKWLVIIEHQTLWSTMWLKSSTSFTVILWQISQEFTLVRPQCAPKHLWEMRFHCWREILGWGRTGGSLKWALAHHWVGENEVLRCRGRA